MNNIFQKNLIALNSKNPELVKKLQGYIPTEIPQLVQENNAYNLLYKGRLVHNQQSPLGEAREIFTGCTNEPTSIHLIYGLGLGYLFQVVALNSKGSVILYEPDLNIIWFAFTLVDFSTDILRENVFISNDFDEISEAIYRKSGVKNFPEMLSLSSQRNFDPEGFEELVQKFQGLVGSFSLDLKYTKERLYPSLKMTLENIPKLIKETPLAYFKDFYKGKTAVIVSAGPSLDKNIETLKRYRDRFILFTVGTAAKTLYKHNIKPDFLCIIETYNSSKQISGLDLSEVFFITEPYSHTEIRNFNYKKTFSHCSSNMPTNQIWANICEENVKEYASKGTVSYTALNSARLLGCSKMILVGQDLAYLEGQCYSKDSAYKDLCCSYNNETNKWEITAKDFESFANAISAYDDLIMRERIAKERLVNLNNSLYYVKGIKGNMIPTESVYSTFIRHLSEFTKIYNDREYINTSLEGALIDGFKNISLEEALKDSEAVGNIEINDSFEYKIDLIKENLNNIITELELAKEKIQDGKRHSKSLNNDLTRYRSINPEILKTLKKLSVNYLELSGDFSNKSKIFEAITASEKIDLDFEMKMIKEFNFESVNRLNSHISKYLANAEIRIIEIENIINKNIAEI